MCLQRDHHPVFLSIADRVIHKFFRYPVMPVSYTHLGTSNPSDVEMAISLGLDVVKFFPAEQAGGINMIKAMAAPYTQMKFMPTGGITAKNINSYLAFDKILACGGSCMVKKDLVAAGEFDKSRDRTKEAVQTMLGLSLIHI